MRLNILIVSTAYLPETGKGGGVATSIYELSHALSDRGHDVTVLAGTNNKEKVSQVKKVKVYRINKAFSYIKKNSKMKKQYYNWSYSYYQKIIELSSYKQFHIILFNELGADGYVYLKQRFEKRLPDSLKNTKVVVRIASSTKPTKLKQKRISNRQLRILVRETVTLLASDLIISPCRKTVKIIEEIFNCRLKNVKYIYNMTDTNKFKPNDNKKGIKKQDVIFGNVGKISKAKGADTIIRAFNLLANSVPDVRLVIVAPNRQNNYEKYIRKLSKDVTSRMHYLGYVKREKLDNVLRGLDVFIYASRYDNCPNSVIEALSSGVPLIYSNVGAVAEYMKKFKYNCGFKPGDINGLYKLMLKFYKNKKLRDKASRENRKEAVQLFSKSIIAKEYEKAFLSLISH